MARSLPLRENPSRLLRGCRAVLCLAYPYGPSIPSTPEGFRAARYTEYPARDYHQRVRAKARPLADRIRRAFPGARSRICVDSAPLMERSLALDAGLGFIGKNTTLILPPYGSYVFLAEILTTAPLPMVSAQPGSDERCGSCTLCLDACPTGALEAPFRLDARRCLSYLTIEHSGTLPAEARTLLGDCFFGCDRCQEVCPYNRLEGSRERRPTLPPAQEILEMEDNLFRACFGPTAFGRVTPDKLKDNLRAVMRES